MSNERNFTSGLLTFLAGAAVGAGLALLFAPQSGKETRQKIKDSYEKVTDDVKEGYDKFSKEAQKAINSVKATSEKAVSQIKSFVGKGGKEEVL